MSQSRKAQFLLAGLIVLTTSAGIIVTSGILFTQVTVSTTGTIVTDNVNIGVYSDASCQISLGSLSFGSVYPGDTIVKTVYLKNNGNTLSVLSCVFNGWNPSQAVNYIIPSWDGEGANIDVNEVLSVNFTINIKPNVSGFTNFAFVINIQSNKI